MRNIGHHVANHARRAERGFLLLSLMVTTVMITLIMVATMQTITQNYDVSIQDTYKVQAQFAADSGADYGIEQVLADSSWTGTPSEVTLSNDALSKTTYQVTVTTAPDGQTKTLDATGKTYVPATSSTAKSTSKIEVGLKGNGASGVDGGISAYIGSGGLIMNGSSTVSDGIVYSNGPINISGAAHIGTSSHTVDVYSADMTCPVGGGSGYPRLCALGENNNPITLPSSGTFIYGTVRANNQLVNRGMTKPGLVSGSVSASDLPSDDRASRINAIVTSGQAQTGTAASCAGVTTKTWPANLKITGNVVIDSSCQVTALGDVWITGNLTVTGAAKLIVKSGLTTPPHIMIDGSSGFVLSNSGMLVPNAGNTGFRVVTYYSTNSCTVSASGCTISGSDLYNSQSLLTISIAGATQSLKTQYYARWSMVEEDGSADVGALVGQTMKLTGTADIHSGVAVDPSQPGTVAWSVTTYKRIF